MTSWHAYLEPDSPPRSLTIAGGAAAALAAGLGMLLLREIVQVRSIPERVMEWLLLFVPLDVFESALQRFGFSAKRYALYFGILGMLAFLTWLGHLRFAAALVDARAARAGTRAVAVHDGRDHAA